jgi:hypothetical protein
VDLKTWEREIATVYHGLVQAERVMASAIDGPIKTIAKLKTLIHRYQRAVTQDLEKILYLASPKGSFRPNDKILLYWATQYSALTQKLIREADKKNVFAMWLNLVQHRVVGHASAVSWSLLKFGQNALFLQAQRRKKLNTQSELLGRLQAIAATKLELTDRYNSLVLTRANRDAAGCLQMSFGATPADALKHPLLETIERLLLNGSLRIRKSDRRRFSETAANFDRLTQFVQGDPKNLPNGPTTAFGFTGNHLTSFDKLSDRLMGIDPLRDAAIGKLSELQTKRTNREAAENNFRLLEGPASRGYLSRSNQVSPLSNLKTNT